MLGHEISHNKRQLQTSKNDFDQFNLVTPINRNEAKRLSRL